MFFDFAPPRVFDFDEKLSRNVEQIILCHHETKQFFPCVNWLVTCFWFQNIFSKNINCYQLWWKTYTKRCISNYVTLRVRIRILSSPALCWQVFSVSWYDLENKRMPCKHKNCIKSMAVKIPISIFFRFCLLCWLKEHLFCVLFLLYLQVVWII